MGKRTCPGLASSAQGNWNNVANHHSRCTCKEIQRKNDWPRQNKSESV